MYLTQEILTKYRACEQGKAFFQKIFPNGIEIIDLLDKHIPYDFLYWGYDNLPLSEEEKNKYLNTIKVTNCEAFYHCNNCDSSTFISESDHVTESERIFDSKQVARGKVVLNSKYITNSKNVYNSYYIDNSEYIIESTNITDSKNVVNSSFIIKSDKIYETSTATNSQIVRNSSNVDDCLFCAACHNLKQSMFCYGIDGLKLDQNNYLLFNKPVSETFYNIIKKQYETFMLGEHINFFEEVNTDSIHPCIPAIVHNYQKQFASLSPDFFTWAKSLPNFDKTVFYCLTLNDSFLI